MATMVRTIGTVPSKGKVNKTNVALWVTQGALALLFLFAGASKLVMSGEELTSKMDLGVPVSFLRFIGVCEVAGALGLILPGISRIRTGLTPLAAAGLVVIMIGATVICGVALGLADATFPFVVGIACAYVAYGRTHLAPISGR